MFGCFLSHILPMLVLPILSSFKPHLFVSRHIQSQVIVSNGRWRFFSAAQAFSKGQVNQRPFLESFIKWKKKSYVPSGLKVDCPNFFACILNVNLGKLKPWCRMLFLVHPFVKFMLDMKWRKILKVASQREIQGTNLARSVPKDFYTQSLSDSEIWLISKI